MLRSSHGGSFVRHYNRCNKYTSSRAGDTLTLIKTILTIRPEKEVSLESSGKDKDSKGERKHTEEK